VNEIEVGELVRHKRDEHSLGLIVDYRDAQYEVTWITGRFITNVHSGYELERVDD
jgi:hypothetical protein